MHDWRLGSQELHLSSKQSVPAHPRETEESRKAPFSQRDILALATVPACSSISEMFKLYEEQQYICIDKVVRNDKVLSTSQTEENSFIL